MHTTSVIRNMLRFERSLDFCLNRLEERYRDLHPEIDWSARDEIESIASASGSFPAPSSASQSRVRFGHIGQERKAEKLRTKVFTLESENQKLKQQLQQMEKLLAINGMKEGQTREVDEKKMQDGNVVLAEGEITEGEVWNLVKSN